MFLRLFKTAASSSTLSLVAIVGHNKCLVQVQEGKVAPLGTTRQKVGHNLCHTGKKRRDLCASFFGPSRGCGGFFLLLLDELEFGVVPTTTTSSSTRV